MLITCKCLNVSIVANGKDISEVDISQLGLAPAELNEQFFKEDIGKVETERITKEQAALVQLRNAGSWVIHLCLNCSMNTHAIHREKGASYVLVNKGLMTNPEEIIAAKNSDRYSTVFRVVVFDSVEPINTSIPSPSKFSATRGTLHTSLQQQLAEAIQRETLLTEERVRAYTEQEYAALDRFREQANNEHRILSRLLFKAEDLNSSGNPSDKSNKASGNGLPPTSPTKPPLNPHTRLPPPPLASPNPSSVSPNRNAARTGGQVSPKRTTQSASAVNQGRPSGAPVSPVGSRLNAQLKQARTIGHGAPRSIMRRIPNSNGGSRRNQPSDSYDSEGLFDLEGMDENPAEAFQSGEESDTDGFSCEKYPGTSLNHKPGRPVLRVGYQNDFSDSGSHDEGIHIPRQRITPQVAKSVPMNVPMYVPNGRGGDESEDERPLQDPMDIAASIKALAKSLHGDANVFGDLPRPRFSTEL